ncbi:MAG: hypothetical protein AB9842_04075 [Bacteroidales bacterium]
MKKTILFLILLSQFALSAFSQCDYNIKQVNKEGFSKTFQMITKDLVFQGKGGADLQFNVCEANGKYYLNGRVLRNLSSKFTITSKSPLILSYGGMKDIVLFPLAPDSSNNADMQFEITLWSRYGSVLYEMTKEQLSYLSENIPSEIRMHFTSEKVKSKQTDKYGAYWLLDFRLEFWYKKFMKVAECALVQLN